MEFKVAYLRLSLRLVNPVDIEDFYNGILSFLGLHKICLSSKKSKYYACIRYYKGIYIKIPKSNSLVQDFIIEFTQEGLETYIHINSHSVKLMLYSLYDMYSETCVVTCRRIDIVTDYIPTHISKFIESFCDKSIFSYSIGFRTSDLRLSSFSNSNFKLHIYCFNGLFSQLVVDDYLINSNCFSDNFKGILSKCKPKCFNSIRYAEVKK